MNHTLKLILALFVVVATVGLVVTWEFYLKDRVGTDDVLVVKSGETIEAKETLNGDEFVVEKRPREHIAVNALGPEDRSSIAGKMALAPLSGNAQVSTSHIDFEGIEPDPEDNEEIRPIPEEWVYSKPGSLRRKDNVNIYVLASSFATTEEESSEEEEGVLPEEATDNLNEDGNADDEQATSYTEPLLEQVPVIYAKDGSNKEVVDESGKDRLNASGRISNLELNMTDSDFTKLASYIEEGYQMYITYH